MNVYTRDEGGQSRLTKYIVVVVNQIGKGPGASTVNDRPKTVPGPELSTPFAPVDGRKHFGMQEGALEGFGEEEQSVGRIR